MENKEITVEFVPARESIAYGLGRGVEDLKKIILEGGEISFDLDANSKTMLSTRVFSDKINLRANLTVEGFKTVERDENNAFESVRKQNYFKLSKKQGADQYKLYLKAIIAKLEELLDVEIKQTSFKVHTQVFQA